MSNTRYTADHEWVRLEAGVATVGITNHAQTALGDIVFVELPDPGREIEAGEACAVVESVKAASDIYAPLRGHITETNPEIIGDPAMVNRDPESEGWFFRMIPADLAAFDALMDADAYAKLVESL